MIENEYEVLKGALPRGYTTFEPDLLAEIVKIFGRDSLTKATGDVFGRIYEYFLNKFAQSGAQEGGEFFTPPSLVRLIVNVIEPDHGIILDPAVRSAGMAELHSELEELNEKSVLLSAQIKANFEELML